MSTRTAVVVGGNRTPFVKAGGRYASASAQDLLTAALDGLVARFGLAGLALVIGSVGLRSQADPIHTAAKKGDVGQVKLLLSGNPALVRAPANDGKTPLHFAAAGTTMALATFILDKGADVKAVDANGLTPLHIAVLHNQKGMIQLLIARGANINAKDKNGRTPLKLANIKNFKDVAVYLQDRGAVE